MVIIIIALSHFEFILKEAQFFAPIPPTTLHGLEPSTTGSVQKDTFIHFHGKVDMEEGRSTWSLSTGSSCTLLRGENLKFSTFSQHLALFFSDLSHSI